MPVPFEHLPPTGLIVENIAACFLYRTDTPVALVEHLISNPKSDETERRQAVSEIIGELLAEAKRQGAAIIYALTPISGVAERAAAFKPTHVEAREFILLRRKL